MIHGLLAGHISLALTLTSRDNGATAWKTPHFHDSSNWNRIIQLFHSIHYIHLVFEIVLKPTAPVSEPCDPEKEPLDECWEKLFRGVQFCMSRRLLPHLDPSILSRNSETNTLQYRDCRFRTHCERSTVNHPILSKRSVCYVAFCHSNETS